MKMLIVLVIFVATLLSGCRSVQYFPKDKYMETINGQYAKTIVQVDF